MLVWTTSHHSQPTSPNALECTRDWAHLFLPWLILGRILLVLKPSPDWTSVTKARQRAAALLSEKSLCEMLKLQGLGRVRASTMHMHLQKHSLWQSNASPWDTWFRCYHPQWELGATNQPLYQMWLVVPFILMGWTQMMAQDPCLGKAFPALVGDCWEIRSSREMSRLVWVMTPHLRSHWECDIKTRTEFL